MLVHTGTNLRLGMLVPSEGLLCWYTQVLDLRLGMLVPSVGHACDFHLNLHFV